MGKELPHFLQELVEPTLALFHDEDPRVRYYACESLYNISKVAGDTVLLHFNPIFDGLSRLYADVDADVKNGVHVLDRLMKDIVTQNPAQFQVAEFIPLLAQRMTALNPFIRQLVLAWIRLLLDLPQVEMVAYVPEYLEGLFNFLGDQARDIKHNADACLQKLQECITSSKDADGQFTCYDKALKVISKTTRIVCKCCRADDKDSRLTALYWLQKYVVFQTSAMQQGGEKPTEDWVAQLPDLVSGTVHCIDDPEEDINRMAVDTNSGLLDMVHALDSEIAVEQLVDQLVLSMQSKDSMVVRIACLQWVCMLLGRNPSQMLAKPMLPKILTPIFETLLHPENEVVIAAVAVLARIMEGRNKEEDEVGGEDDANLFIVTTRQILQLVLSEHSMVETRGQLMIRQLCGHLDARRLYVTIARAIEEEVTDTNVAQKLVQTFNWILLTAKETTSVREELLTTTPLSEMPCEDTPGTDGTPLFLELIEPWFHSPVSALALCLWSQQYELATELTNRFAGLDPTLDFLKQLDQLVHLLESPVFSRLRLHLLEPRRHPDLLKCLLGLAMLLPQAAAFNILRERIHVVHSGLLLEAAANDRSGAGNNLLSLSHSDIGGNRRMAALLERFDAIAAQ